MAVPTWNDAISVVAGQKVAVGATARGTLNLSGLFSGYLFLRAMRLSSSTPSNGIYAIVRRILKGQPFGGGAGVDITHPGAMASFQDVVTASNLTTLNGSPTIPGAAVTLTSATGFAGNQWVGITDSTTTPTVLEFARTSKVSGTTLTMDRNLTNSGILTGATITNQAFVLPPIWVEGTPNTGDIEVIFDLGLESTVAYAVEAWAQSLSAVG